MEDGVYNVDAEDYFTSLDKARVPMRYMASLFSAGNEEQVRLVLEKLLTVRTYKRAEEVGDMDSAQVKAMLEKTGLTAEACEEIYRLTSLPTFEERFVVPASHREYVTDMTMDDAYTFKAETGFGGFQTVRLERGT
jgi:nitrate reductase beta subunit